MAWLNRGHFLYLYVYWIEEITRRNLEEITYISHESDSAFKKKLGNGGMQAGYALDVDSVRKRWNLTGGSATYWSGNTLLLLLLSQVSLFRWFLLLLFFFIFLWFAIACLSSSVPVLSLFCVLVILYRVSQLPRLNFWQISQTSQPSAVSLTVLFYYCYLFIIFLGLC